MSASRTMSSARVEPTRIRSTFSAISASRNARQAFFDTVGFSSAKLITLHAVLAMQPRELLGEPHRVAMAPARPEAALAAVVAEVRTAARELHHDRAHAAPVAVARMVDQLPADAVGIEVADHRRRAAWRAGRRASRNAMPATAPRSVAVGERRHQAPRGLLALAAHDRGHMRLLARGSRASDRSGTRRHRRCATRGIAAAIARATSAMTGWPGGRAGMPEQHRVGREGAPPAATMASIGIGPNSPSIRRTSCPSSISGPPIASRPSGGRWSSGMRLPIDGCGTLMRRMRMRV